MAELLRGAPVAEALSEKLKSDVSELQANGVTPTLAILRVGERQDDLSYERGAMKRCASVGVEVKNVVLPQTVDNDTFFKTVDELNRDETVHGILMFRPLPKHIDGERAADAIVPEKDVDGGGISSLGGVFANKPTGFPPCTAEAAMRILDHYGIDCSGKRAAVLGRSLVIGRPVAMMLMHKNATVTICHTKTADVPAIARECDIIVSCMGKAESIGREYLTDRQTVIDVGICWSEEKQKLVGDVKFDEAEPIVRAITPVPGGVGSMTTAVLVSHVVEAAKRTLGFFK